jgi:hypothetical protein
MAQAAMPGSLSVLCAVREGRRRGFAASRPRHAGARAQETEVA